MKLQSEFIRLPFQFDHIKLQDEVSHLNKRDWMVHPNNLPGNFSCPLISVGGENNDLMLGEMLPTKILETMPYVKQILSEIGEVYGRSRLMLLKAGCQVSPHSDLHYHWYNRVRIHIPIITNSNVLFFCANKKVHMEAGSTWIFDSWKNHSVYNNSNQDRIHLVLDTCGSFNFWKLVEQLNSNPLNSSPKISYFAPTKLKTLIQAEKHSIDSIMQPGEVDALCSTLVTDAKAHPDNNPTELSKFSDTLLQFKTEWRINWLLYSDQISSLFHFQELIQRAVTAEYNVTLSSNGADGKKAFFALILGIASETIEKLLKDISPIQENILSAKTTDTNKNTKVTSRNSPCPCGSEKKYKNCCGKLTSH